MGNKLGTSGNTMKAFYPPNLTSYQTSHLLHETTNCLQCTSEEKQTWILFTETAASETRAIERGN